MNVEITGKVISAKRQWWCKVNTKPVRGLGSDGAQYPYVIKVLYVVDGKSYTKKKWIAAGQDVPFVGTGVAVAYDESKPSRAKVL